MCCSLDHLPNFAQLDVLIGTSLAWNPNENDAGQA